MKIRFVVPALLSVFTSSLVGVLYLQARRKPVGNPRYVALGSSFAAGLGLGQRAPGSPLVCMRSVNGYPQQLARLRGLELVDVTCSGAKSSHVLHGGWAFLPPQVDALSSDTQLVTLTIGGNDIGYVGDLTMMAGRHGRSLSGWAMRQFSKGPRLPGDRDWAGLRTDLSAILSRIKHRSPQAKIVVVTYPTILPPQGTCSKLAITAAEAATMRDVGEQLAEVTRNAAQEAGAILVDMQRIGAEHHACAEQPWVNGFQDPAGAKFHPTLAGAEATAAAIGRALDEPTKSGAKRKAGSKKKV